MSQQLQQQVAQLQQQLIQSQSRSFELVSQLSAERDVQKNMVAQYEQIIKEFGGILNLTEISPQTIANTIQQLLLELKEATAKKTPGKKVLKRKK